MTSFYKRFSSKYLSPYSNRNHSILPDWKELITIAEVFNDLNYAEQQAKISPAFLIQRLSQLGLFGGAKVLDLGCGYGQWSLALRHLNQSVIGIDLHANRIKIAKLLGEATLSSADGLEFHQGEATDLSIIADNSLDSIFCFGVFMFLDSRAMLTESLRVLKPGGKLYICTNSSGWWSYLMITRGFRNRHLFISSARALILKSRSIPSSFSRRRINRLLQELGFTNIEVALEGNLGTDRSMNTYKHRFLFMPMCIESIAAKPGAPIEQSSLESVLENGLKGLANKRPLELSFLDALGSQIDYLGTCGTTFVENQLRGLNPLTQLVAAHKFVGSQIFHDLELQHVDSSGNVPENIAISLELKSGRCGVKARALADVLTRVGWKAGIIITGSHVLTWVNYNSQYLVLDSDIFSPGAISLINRETPFSLSEFLENDQSINHLPNSSHFLDSRNQHFLLDAPDSLRRIALPSTLLNSESGQVELIERVCGRDIHKEFINVPQRPIQFLEIPPVLKVNETELSFNGRLNSKYILLGGVSPQVGFCTISELTKIQDVQNFLIPRNQIPPHFRSVCVVEASCLDLNPGLTVKLISI